MSETIENFVKKLQDEGVEAGQAEAAKLRAEAEAKAEEITRNAEAEAKKIKENAENEAEKTLARSKTELELAARDAALKLQDVLSNALQEILAGSMDEQLDNPDFLKQLIADVVGKYAETDSGDSDGIVINVREELKSQLDNWALKELRKAGKGDVGIDLQGTLKQAGFEYTISGGTVEVTKESIVETLGEMLSASLRETLKKVIQKGNS